MKLLAINFGGLGDEILFLPTLKSIKISHPDWQITLLTEPRARSIAQLTSLIDKNIVFDIKKSLGPADYFELIALLQKEKYDIVLSSGSTSKVSVLLFLSGIPKRIGFDSGWLSKLLLTDAVKLNKEQYAGFMYHDLVSGLALSQQPQAPEIELCKESLASMKSFLAESRAGSTDKKLVLIHPGMSQMALKKGIMKTWAAANWSELTARLIACGKQVILCGGPDDETTIAEISRALSGRLSQEAAGADFINAYGKTGSIKDLASLMNLSDLVICVDSAPMHMASALKKNLIALFGPTDPDKLLIQNKNSIAIKAESKSEAKTQTEPCVQIQPDIVFRTAMDLLKQASIQESSLECH